jgi:vacuolar-type H+-ATPase subunit H
MSDMLKQLLGVEKTAASIVTEAEAEAGRLAAQARQDAQRKHAELLKTQAAENEASLATQRVTLDAERATRSEAERGKLARLPSDTARFRAATLSFIEKGKE